MTPAGLKHERETIIRWDEEVKDLHVWTSSGVMYRKLLILGYKPVVDEAKHAVFSVPFEALTIRREKPLKVRSGISNETGQLQK